MAAKTPINAPIIVQSGCSFSTHSSNFMPAYKKRLIAAAITKPTFEYFKKALG